MDITVAQLEAVVHVADCGSFTQAAQSLHLTQPALSHRVAEMERLVGLRIFDRSRRSVRVTERGRGVIEAARAALTKFERGLEKIFVAAGRARQRVRLAAIPSLAAVAMPDILKAVEEEHPNVECTLRAANAHDVLTLAHNGTCDIGLTALEGSYSSEFGESVYDDQFVALLPEGHRLTSQESVTWKELTAERFVMPPVTSSLHYLHVEAMAASESYPALTLPGDSIAVTAGLVASGLGVAAMPTSALLLARFARLVTRPLVAPAVSRPIYVVTAEKDPGSTVSMVVDKIQQFFKTPPSHREQSGRKVESNVLAD